MKKLVIINALLCIFLIAIGFIFDMLRSVLLPLVFAAIILVYLLLLLSKLSPLKAGFTLFALHSAWVIVFYSYFAGMGNIDGTTRWARAMVPVIIVDTPWNIIVYRVLGIRSIFNVGVPFFVYSLLVPGILYSAVAYLVVRGYLGIQEEFPNH